MSKFEQLVYNLCQNGVEYKTIGEICTVSVGGDVPKGAVAQEKTEKYNIPIISNGVGDNAIYGYTNEAKISFPAVTIAARGTIGYAEYRDYPYYPIIRLLSVIPKDISIIETKYIYYCLQGRKYSVSVSGIPQLTMPELKKVIIPVPPIEVQREIVRILDNFTELTAELTARKKQYEYYRDKLLTFKEKDAYEQL